ncbi:MAG: alpha/beta hydrolase [Opitutaceae bacterium]
MSPKYPALVRVALLLPFLSSTPTLLAADPASAALPPLPPAMNIPKPGPVTDAPYAPQPILPGGVVVPLFPAGSPYLKAEKVREAEVYNMNGSAPGRIASIVKIHNPSIEFHAGNRALNTGAVVIVVAGGGHRTLNVGGEGADFVPFFANYGINTVILRNRLRSDGYDAKTDAVYDAQQAIKIVRAYAGVWKIDPNKIGIMGFSAGAELAAPAGLFWAEFDAKNNVPGNPFAAISSRPDFVGVVYPGPTPFTAPRGPNATPGTEWKPPAIPRDAPPSFTVCAGFGDRGHAIWANEWFTAMLNAGIPNVEMHIYARGRHPGDTPFAGDPPSTGGLTNRGGIALGTWQDRFIEWMRDLGFLSKSGVETLAAKDATANLMRPAPGTGGGGRRGGPGAPGAAPVPSPK